MMPWRIEELKEQYAYEGWKRDLAGLGLSFVSPCGRWFDSYCLDTSRFYRIDGEWMINLKVTKSVEQEEVLSEKVQVS